MGVDRPIIARPMTSFELMHVVVANEQHDAELLSHYLRRARARRCRGVVAKDNTGGPTSRDAVGR
jgi:hypothetical protein